jgi:hypothetical protein
MVIIRLATEREDILYIYSGIGIEISMPYICYYIKYTNMRWMALGIKIIKIANVYGFKIFYKTGVKKIQDFKIFIKNKKLKTSISCLQFLSFSFQVYPLLLCMYIFI